MMKRLGLKYHLGIGKIHISCCIVYPRLSNWRTKSSKTRGRFLLFELNHHLKICFSFRLFSVIIWNMNTNSLQKPKINVHIGLKFYAMLCKKNFNSNKTNLIFSDRCSNPELSENGHYFQMKSFDEIDPRCDHCKRYLW
jgi:hypothetical protein